MLHTKWDDPCGIGDRLSSPLILPETGPSDLKKIRHQQTAIIPAMHGLRDAANRVLKRGSAIAQSHAQTDLLVEFTFRFPDQPDVVNTYTEQIPAHVVALPASQKLLTAKKFLKMPPAETVFQAHKIQHIVMPDGQVVNGEEMRVIFPELFSRVSHWIREMEGAICDVNYGVPTRTVCATGKLTKAQRASRDAAPGNLN